MFVTGISDEAGFDLEVQIQAHKQLGWTTMEIRDVSINGGGSDNLHNISEEDFRIFEHRMRDAGMEIYCLSSRIANWSKRIDEPFKSSLEEVKRSVDRMRRLGTRFIRIMSFAVRPDGADQMGQRRFWRLRELVRIFRGEGMVVLHENCANYGGMGWPFSLELLENVPDLRLVFDTGNPVFTDDRGKPGPRAKQSAWEFYSHVRDHIDHVHIKDAVWNREVAGVEYCFPGEGQADVIRIINDLATRGYAGALSIEPHMGAAWPDPSSSGGEASAYDTYLEYGRRVSRLAAKAKSFLSPSEIVAKG